MVIQAEAPTAQTPPVEPPRPRKTRNGPRKPRPRTARFRLRDRATILMLAAPALTILTVFAYLPMAGLVVAFKRFNITDGVFRSPWAGLDNFTFFFSSGDASRVLLNTVVLNVLFLASTLVVGLMLAIMLNEIRSKFFRRPLQSAIFFPYFVSPIVVSVILQVLLAGVGGRGGAVNEMLSIFSLPSVSWYTEPGPWPWILTIVKVWQLGGYTSIIFLAAITAIPEEVYEAGALDGASRARMALHITAPLLRPTAAVLILLGVGRIFFGDFGTIYAIVGDNGTLFPTTDVIDTYVYRALRMQGDFGTTAAIGLFQSVVGFLLISIATVITRRYSRETSLI
jgi:putative aldouronate transport system permease protein